MHLHRIPAHSTRQPLLQGAATISMRYWLFLLAFVLLTTLSLTQSPLRAMTDPTMGTTPTDGTIPPGGTLPAPVIDTTQGQVRVVHLAPIAANLADTTVDICTATNSPITELSGLQYGETSAYVVFAPGEQDWLVSTPGCGAMLVDIPPFSLAPGSAVTLLITGDGVNQPLKIVFIVDEAGLSYRLYLPLIQK